MEQQPNDNQKNGWVEQVENVLLYGQEKFKYFLSYIYSKPAEKLGFTYLPKDIQKTVLFLLAESNQASKLDVAARAINSLAQVNKQLHTLINKPKFCLKLIKHLAQKFDCSDETAAKTLQTQEANNLLAIQKKFEKLFLKVFFSTDKFNNLYGLHKNSVDLNFTYQGLQDSNQNDSKNTLLIYAVMHASPYKGSKIDCLLKTDEININYRNNIGLSALMVCAHNCDNPAALQMLCKQPNIIIDLESPHKNTALIYACASTMQRLYSSACIHLLLQAGANPEQTNIDGLTPLLILERIGNDKEIQLIKNAIDKKHNT